jgi:RNA polymerase sigma-70 factor (ECF subfamily)
VDAVSADDVLQEALLKLWRRGVAQVDDPVAYAFSCVRSAALDRIKSEVRRRHREQQVGAHFATAFEPDIAGDDGRDDLLAAVEGLNPSQREVLILRIWGDLSFPAIADALGANVNTVTSRYRAALADLRSRLNPEDW